MARVDLIKLTLKPLGRESTNQQQPVRRNLSGEKYKWAATCRASFILTWYHDSKACAVEVNLAENLLLFFTGIISLIIHHLNPDPNLHVRECAAALASSGGEAWKQLPRRDCGNLWRACSTWRAWRAGSGGFWKLWRGSCWSWTRSSCTCCGSTICSSLSDKAGVILELSSTQSYLLLLARTMQIEVKVEI